MPKKIELKQNSKDWYAWRGKGIGASEAGTIMGVSPWETPFELWGYKTGLITKPPFNGFAQAAVDKGHRLEPIAREKFEAQRGLKFEAVSYEHEQHAFIRASLDGHNEVANESLEIKCPGKESYKKAVKGEIPDNYYAQMQQQMLVSGAELTHYVVYYEGEPLVVIVVIPDLDYQKALLTRLISFWRCVETKTPPPVDSGDLAKMVDQVNKAQGELNRALSALNILNQAFTSNQFSIQGV